MRRAFLTLVFLFLAIASNAMNQDQFEVESSEVQPVKQVRHEPNTWLDPQEFAWEAHYLFVIFDNGVPKCTADFDYPEKVTYPGYEPLKIRFDLFNSSVPDGVKVPMLFGTKKALGTFLTVAVGIAEQKIEARFSCPQDSLDVRLIEVTPNEIREVDPSLYQILHTASDSCEYHLRRKPL